MDVPSGKQESSDSATEMKEAEREDELQVNLEKVKTELEAERKKSAEYLSRMKYLQADIINMQKQTERMISDSKLQARVGLILEIIELKEDLVRAFNSTKDSESQALIDGLGLLISRVEGLLRSESVQIIQVKIGMKFDPRMHEAVSYSDSEDREEGSILSVIRDGYTINGKVMRPALVEVARKIKKPPLTEGKPDSTGRAGSKEKTLQEESPKI